MPKPLHGRCPFRHRTRTLPTVVSTRSEEPPSSAAAGADAPVTCVTTGRAKWGLAALAAAGCAYVAVVDPNTSSLYPQCPFQAITGYDCPGCGLTRGLHAVLRGDLVQAASHNLLLVIVAVVAVVWFAWNLLRKRRGRRPIRFSLPPPATIALGLAVAAFWVVRNLPMQPFNWLGSGA